MYQPTRKKKSMRETEFILHKKINGREVNIDSAKMAEVSENLIITEKQDNP